MVPSKNADSSRDITTRVRFHTQYIHKGSPFFHSANYSSINGSQCPLRVTAARYMSNHEQLIASSNPNCAYYQIKSFGISFDTSEVVVQGTPCPIGAFLVLPVKQVSNPLNKTRPCWRPGGGLIHEKNVKVW
ncbi:hypothetical protein TNCV_5048401 [Trichonephila clavipes]|nr:hypothetical protein TNCV_5048401 [Trichonephila clavipes]